MVQNFQLLKNIMLNAFQTETVCYKYPYEENLHIPSKLANILCPNFSTTDTRIIPSEQTPNRRLFVVKTNLEFYYIIFYLKAEPNTDFITIGPFRSDALSLSDFSKSLNNMYLSSDNYILLKSFYENLPCIPLQNIVNTSTYIINTYLSDNENILPLYVDFDKLNNYSFDDQINKTAISCIIPDYLVGEAKETLYHLSDSIISGNTETTQKLMKDYLTKSKMLSSENISECKKQLHMINAYFQMAFLKTHCQPEQTLKLILMFSDKIENTHTRDELVKIPYDMCYKYCMLCQNNPFPEYSKTVNDVINYIYSHLQEPLSLSIIAEYLQKNPSTLSASFTQNTGMTITNYIHQARIHRAVEYFNATNLSVSEVALAVGFQDFTHFSRIFRKYMGCNPKKYRDMHVKI